MLTGARVVPPHSTRMNLELGTRLRDPFVLGDVDGTLYDGIEILNGLS